MRIRIIQKIQDGDRVLLPGTVLDEEKKQADKWIKAKVAIDYPEKVKKHDGKNSTKVVESLH